MGSGEGITQSLQRRTRRQKRTQAATLVLMGATPFAILALDPLHNDVQVFQDIEACKASIGSNSAACENLSKEASARHARVAPRYLTMEACEAEFAHVVNGESCQTGWCTAEDLAVCEPAGDGQFRPGYSAFLVGEGVLADAVAGKPMDVASLGDGDLQPVYTVSGESLGEQTSSYYGGSPFLWYYLSSRGSYLGNQNLKGPVTVARSGLRPGTGQLHSASTRGGFGATARQTMQSARS